MSATTSGVVFTQSRDDTHMSLYIGKTLRFEVIWGGSSPIDITGYDAIFQARTYDGKLILELSTTNGGILLDGPNGKMTVFAAASLTQTVRAAGQYELELTSTKGEVFRVMSGGLSIIKEIVK